GPVIGVFIPELNGRAINFRQVDVNDVVIAAEGLVGIGVVAVAMVDIGVNDADIGIVDVLNVVEAYPAVTVLAGGLERFQQAVAACVGQIQLNAEVAGVVGGVDANFINAGQGWRSKERVTGNGQLEGVVAFTTIEIVAILQSGIRGFEGVGLSRAVNNILASSQHKGVANGVVVFCNSGINRNFGVVNITAGVDGGQNILGLLVGQTGVLFHVDGNADFLLESQLILGGSTVDDGGDQQVDGHSSASAVYPVVVAFAVEGGSAAEEVQEHVLDDLGAAHASNVGSVLGLGVDQLGQHLGN